MDESFSRISVAAAKALTHDDDDGVEIYIPSAAGGAPVLYRDAHADLSSPDFDRIERAKVPFLFIRSADLPRYELSLERKLVELLESTELQPAEKAKLVHHVGQSVARDLTANPSSVPDLGRATTLIDSVIGCVLDDPLIAAHILNMAGHQRATASHMFVVSALSVMLGAECLGPDEPALRALGLAGMVHDIGKLNIDPEILNKATSLSAQEAQLIRNHPVESVRMLGDDLKADRHVRQMIMQHHERVDGKGYPLGLTGPELLKGSRILSVADSFHAMIGRRSYRESMTPADATRVLLKQAGTQFDAGVLNCWTRLFARCWSPAEDTAPPDIPKEEVEDASLNEHRVTKSKRSDFGPRPRRHACTEKVMVTCVYEQRIHDITSAPDEFRCAARDVSKNGLCLYSRFPLYRGEILRIRLDHGAKPVWIRGGVAWCSHYDLNVYLIGVQFEKRISAEDRDGLKPATQRSSSTNQEVSMQELDSTPVSTDGSVEDAACDQTPMDDDLATLKRIEDARPGDLNNEREAMKLAKSPHVEVRRKCVAALVKVGSRPARAAIKELLGDTDPGVVLQAVAAAGALRMNETSFGLRKLLKQDDRELALRAAGALGRIHEDIGLPLVLETLNGDSEHTRLAAHTLGQIIGQRFAGNAEGVRAARRYLAARGAKAQCAARA